MPNWCTNRLLVTGGDVTPFVARANPTLPVTAINSLTVGSLQVGPDAANPACGSSDSADLRSRLARAFRAGLDFDGHVPMPSGVPDECLWANQHWGTKWNACDVDVRQLSGSRFDVMFETAWAPPDAWLAAAAEAHPDLRFHLAWYELGVMACGLLRAGPCGTLRAYDYSDDPAVVDRLASRWFGVRFF